MPWAAICINLKGITGRGKRRKITVSPRLRGQALCWESHSILHLTLTGSPGRNVLLLSLWQRPLVLPMSVSPSFLGSTVGQHTPVPHDSSWGRGSDSGPPQPYVVVSRAAFFSLSSPALGRAGRGPCVRDTPWKEPWFLSGSRSRAPSWRPTPTVAKREKEASGLRHYDFGVVCFGNQPAPVQS